MMRSTPPRLVALVAGLVMIMTGCSSSSHASDLEALKTMLGRLPLPAHTSLVKETAYQANGSNPAYLERDYRLASTDATASIHEALTSADYQVVDPHTKKVSDSAWDSSTGPDQGDVYVLPPGKKGDGIELNWNGRDLIVTVTAGQVR